MKISRALMLIVTCLVLAVGAALYTNMGLADRTFCENGQTLAAGCGKCGDGYCNPRCGETATNCPRDCGGVPSAVK